MEPAGIVSERERASVDQDTLPEGAAHRRARLLTNSPAQAQEQGTDGEELNRLASVRGLEGQGSAQLSLRAELRYSLCAVSVLSLNLAETFQPCPGEFLKPCPTQLLPSFPVAAPHKWPSSALQQTFLKPLKSL